MQVSKDLSKAIERCLRYTENACATCTRQGALLTEANSAKAFAAHDDGIETLFKAWRRWDAWTTSVPEAQVADCSRAWLDSFLETKALTRISALLALVSSQAAVATSPSTAPPARQRAIRVVHAAGRTALLLAKQAQTIAALAIGGGSMNATTSALGQRITEGLMQPDFIQAVADAAKGILAVAETLHSETAVRQFPGYNYHATTNALVLGNAASAASWTVSCAVDTLAQLLSSPTALEHRPAVAPAATHIVEALAGSQLLAAAAAALADSPNPLAITGLSLGARADVCKDARDSAATMARSLSKLAALRAELALHRGREGRRLAGALVQVVGHVSVRRLQVALLDQLAAEAGMGAGLEEWTGDVEGVVRLEQQQQQEEGEAEAEEGWAGSSGTWWFAREQAQRGELLGFRSSGRGGRGGRGGGKPQRSTCAQESEHCEALDATVALWSWSKEEVHPVAAAGGPARPPPLLAARLAARAAEALCRLGRGEGLDGGYGPMPSCVFAMDELLLENLLLALGSGTTLPAATAQACLPHWLQAAGWALAALSDSTGAAALRLAACPEPGPQRSCIEEQMSTVIDSAVSVMGFLDYLARHEQHGFTTLTPAAQADVRRRLFRCGVATSLDRLLRLLLSRRGDQEGLGAAGVACSAPGDRATARLLAAILCVGAAAGHGVVPLLPPPVARGSSRTGGSSSKSSGSGSSRNSGGGSSSRSTGGDGGSCAHGNGTDADGGGCSAEGAHHQLGLLHTLSKQAGVLSRELQEARGLEEDVSGVQGVQGSGASVGGEGRRGVGDGPSQLLTALCAAMGEVGPTGEGASLWAAAATGATAEGQQQQGMRGGAVCWQGEAWGGGEARETLALAARAACSLGTSLAWALAADVAAAAAAEGLGMTGAEEGTDEGEGGVKGAVEGEGKGVPDAPRVRRASLKAVGRVLYCMVHLWRDPSALCTAQLLACQPHRLPAAACALAATLPQSEDGDRSRMTLLSCISAIVVILSRHEALSGYARGWLAPPPLPPQQPGVSYGDGVEGGNGAVGGGGCGGGTGGGAGGGVGVQPDAACAGCLAAPLEAAMQQGLRLVPKLVVPALMLLRLAASSGGSGGHQKACEGAPGGSFQQYAASAAEFVLRVADDPAVLDTQEEPVLPDGTEASRLLLQGDTSAVGGHLPPAPPSGALPPPLALPPSLAGSFPHLRVCGNPRCTNFAEESEGSLPLKQCGGCRAVRYCGKDCQGAHWRGGHRAECRVLRLERGEAADQPGARGA